MSRSRAELIDWVQSRIDELGVADQPSTIDPAIISFEIDEAANNLVRSAERNIVYPLASKLTPDYCLVRSLSSAPLSVIVPLPANVIRLLRSQLYDWNAGKDIFSSVDSPEYLRQLNPSERATVNVPECALIPFVFSYSDGASTTTDFTRAIECFPSPASIGSAYRTTPLVGNATENNIAAAAAAEGLSVIFETGLGAGQHKEIRTLLVITRKTAEQLPDDLHSPLVWMCAEQLLRSMREEGDANILLADSCAKAAAQELQKLSNSILGK